MQLTTKRYEITVAITAPVTPSSLISRKLSPIFRIIVIIPIHPSTVVLSFRAKLERKNDLNPLIK